MALALRGSYSTPSNSTRTQSGVSVVAGDLIIVGWRADGPGILHSATCADNAAGGSNEYREAGSGIYVSNAVGELHLFYAIAKATETLTLTITTPATGYMVITVHVVSGALQDINSVLDKHAFGAPEVSADTAHTTASITTTYPEAYLFTFWSQDQANGISLFDADIQNPFTKRQENTDWSIGGPSTSFDKIVSTTGLYLQGVTSSGLCYETSVIAAFKAAANGPIINSFTATPEEINPGASSTLAWSITGTPTSLSINNGVGSVLGQSNISVSPSASTTYTLTAVDGSGTREANVTVEIIGPAFQANAFQNDAFQVATGTPTYDATKMFALF